VENDRSAGVLARYAGLSEKPQMDPLLDMLRTIRLTGGIFLEADFTAPWCVTSEITADDFLPHIAVPAHVVAYHYVVEGRVELLIEGEPPRGAEAGSIIVFPRNDRHRVGSELGSAAASMDHLIQPGDSGNLARIRHGGGGAATRILCGYLGSDTPNHPIFAALPRVMTLDVANGASGNWIEASIRYAANELESKRTGSLSVLSKLAELLFVEAVRRYADTTPCGQSGWLSGLRDPVIGRALALAHGQATRRWTSVELAREAGLSRSAFTDRFIGLVGIPPIRYLALWRLQSAADRLRDTTDTISRIAYDSGYESEAAFSRAFKRAFGLPPAAWRRQALASAA
jgi:AraC-like DNA-binding protein